MTFAVRDVDNNYKCRYSERRYCFGEIYDYICSDDSYGKICAIYGLRRTGKTVLMQQCMEEMPSLMKKKTLSILCFAETDFYELVDFMKGKVSEGYKYFFIDEITYAKGFQEIGEILANLFVENSDAKIVVTGTDSLGLALPAHDLQYNRTKFVYTTYIPFAEYLRLTGCDDMDEYIRKGSVLQPDALSDYNKTHEYVKTSITENLINSLEKSEGISRYPAQLTEIYENDELRNVIERIINKFSQDITAKSIRKEFESGIVSASIRNIAKSDVNPDNIKVVLNNERLNDEIRRALGILRNDEVIVRVTEPHKQAVYDFLREMDVLTSIPVYGSLLDSEYTGKIEMISHPGICYNNIYHSLKSLQNDKNWLEGATYFQRQRLINASLNYACGSLMENIIIADTYFLLCADRTSGMGNGSEKEDSKWYVSKLNTTINGKTHEADMIIADKETEEVFLFEIKHSKQIAPEQSIHLEDEEFISYIEKNFGQVKRVAVLYNGETSTGERTPRVSAKDFLCELYRVGSEPNFSLNLLLDELCSRDVITEEYETENDEPMPREISLNDDDLEL